MWLVPEPSQNKKKKVRLDKIEGEKQYVITSKGWSRYREKTPY